MTRVKCAVVATAFVHKTLFEGHPFDILQSERVNYRKNFTIHTNDVCSFFLRFVTFNNLCFPFSLSLSSVSMKRVCARVCMCILSIDSSIMWMTLAKYVYLKHAQSLAYVKKPKNSLASFTVWCEMRAHHLSRHTHTKVERKTKKKLSFLVCGDFVFLRLRNNKWRVQKKKSRKNR